MALRDVGMVVWGAVGLGEFRGVFQLECFYDLENNKANSLTRSV